MGRTSRQGPLLEGGGGHRRGGGAATQYRAGDSAAGMESWNADVVGAPEPPHLATAFLVGMLFCGILTTVLLVLILAIGLPLALVGWAWALSGDAAGAPAVIGLDAIYVLAYGALGFWMALGRPPWQGLRSVWGRWSFFSLTAAGVIPLVAAIAAFSASLQGSGGPNVLLAGAACQTISGVGILAFWSCDVMDYRQIWKVP